MLSHPPQPPAAVFNLKLTAFLNKCIEPVSASTLHPADVQDFMRSLGADAAKRIVPILSIANPDLIIRSFFSQHLSTNEINFLKKAVIIIQSPLGIFDYSHSNQASSSRRRHEIRVGFLGLFLLTYYGLTLRIMSVENSIASHGQQARIGIWHRAIDKFLDSPANEFFMDSLTIQIVPPKDQDLSLSLEIMADLSKKDFNICSPVVDYQPSSSAAKLFNFHKLLGQSLKSLERLVYFKVDEIATTIIDRSSQIQKNSNDLDSKVSKIKEFISTAVPPKLRSMFEVETAIVFVSSNELPISFVYSNLLYILNLVFVAKQQANFLFTASKDTPYLGGDVSTIKSALETWIASLLLNADPDNVFVESMGKLCSIISHFGLTKAKLHLKPLAIPMDVFVEIISNPELSKKLTELMSHSEKILEHVNHMAQLASLSSQELLRRLLENKKSKSVVFIRKILLTDDGSEKLKEEFMPPSEQRPFLIAPFTMVSPSLEIELSKKVWEPFSGIVVSIPPGDIPMVAYKRHAFSNLLMEDKTQIISFPLNTTKLMQPQGGRPSYNIPEFYRTLKTIYCRARGQMPDMDRKTFLRNLFLECTAILSDSFTQSLQFTLDEQSVILGQMSMKALDDKNSEEKVARSPSFELYQKITNVLLLKLKVYLQHQPDIADYYALLYKNLVRDALQTQLDSLKVTLDAELDILNNKLKQSIAEYDSKEKVYKDKLASFERDMVSSIDEKLNVEAQLAELLAVYEPQWKVIKDEIQGFPLKSKNAISAITLAPLNYLLYDKMSHSLIKKSNHIRLNKYNERNPLNPDQHALATASVKQYFLMGRGAFAANEALLQGVAPSKNEEKPNLTSLEPLEIYLETKTSSFYKEDEAEFCAQLLFVREGFIVALAVTEGPVGHKSVTLSDHLFKKVYHQDKTFISYKPGEFKVLTEQEKQQIISNPKVMEAQFPKKTQLAPAPLAAVKQPAPSSIGFSNLNNSSLSSTVIISSFMSKSSSLSSLSLPPGTLSSLISSRPFSPSSSLIFSSISAPPPNQQANHSFIHAPIATSSSSSSSSSKRPLKVASPKEEANKRPKPNDNKPPSPSKK